MANACMCVCFVTVVVRPSIKINVNQISEFVHVRRVWLCIFFSWFFLFVRFFVWLNLSLLYRFDRNEFSFGIWRFFRTHFVPHLHSHTQRTTDMHSLWEENSLIPPFCCTEFVVNDDDDDDLWHSHQDLHFLYSLEFVVYWICNFCFRLSRATIKNGLFCCYAFLYSAQFIMFGIFLSFFPANKRISIRWFRIHEDVIKIFVVFHSQFEHYWNTAHFVFKHMHTHKLLLIKLILSHLVWLASNKHHSQMNAKLKNWFVFFFFTIPHLIQSKRKPPKKTRDTHAHKRQRRRRKNNIKNLQLKWKLETEDWYRERKKRKESKYDWIQTEYEYEVAIIELTPTHTRQ